MGEELALVFDRSPDFFARHKAYERWLALVAESPEGKPIATGAVAFKRVLAEGRPVEVAYLMDLRVHPAWRRQGVATTIGDSIRQRLEEHSLAFAYTMVLRGNEPSARLLSKRGFFLKLGRVRVGVLVAKSLEPKAPDLELRTLGPRDVPWLAERWASCTGSWSLALPLDEKGLTHLMEELLKVPEEDRLLIASRGVPVGAAALWQYSRIMTISFLKLPEEISCGLPSSLKSRLSGGRPFHLYYPLPLVWRSIEDIPLILRSLLHHLEAKHSPHDRLATLWVPMDDEGPLPPWVMEQASLSFELDLFGAPLQGRIPKEGPFFIDPRDL
jgi:GNAT superfamily N-acetyltransferase